MSGLSWILDLFSVALLANQDWLMQFSFFEICFPLYLPFECMRTDLWKFVFWNLCLASLVFNTSLCGSAGLIK